MALTGQSLFLYNFEVDDDNAAIDFRVVPAETPRQATLRFGFYSLSSLMIEIVRALTEVAPSNVFTATADRTIAGGTENLVTLGADTADFELLFGTGPRASVSVAELIGFTETDLTGAATYPGTTSAGTRLFPNLTGYNFLAPEFDRKVFGNVNISASGQKEAIVYNIQQFWQVSFRYIPESTWTSQWTPLFNWMIQQRLLEFTPNIASPNTVLESTLESTNADGKGLGFRGNEMLPGFPFQYETGLMRFRLAQILPTL